MIVMTRIDHRLLHGQVAVAWAKSLQINCILIVNDDVANDDFRKNLLRMAKPQDCKLIFKTIQDAADALNSGKSDAYRLYIVLESIKDALRFCELCPAVTYINLGLSETKEHAKNIGRSVYVNDQEIEDLKKMVDRGITIELQQTPNDSSININTLL